MKLYKIITCIALALPLWGGAQNNLKSSDKALLIMGLTENRTIKNQFEKRIIIPEDYYSIEISDNVLKPLDENVSGNSGSEKFTEQDLNLLLNNNKVGQQILSYWFQRQDDGTFDLNAIREKGIPDVSTIEKLSSSGKKKISSKDAGVFDIINNTYILLVDFKNIKTMEEYYDENKVGNDYRTLFGYISSFNYYLVKLDFNEYIAAQFIEKYWISENAEESLNKKKEFVSTDFPFILIKSREEEIASTVQKNSSNIEIGDKQQNEDFLGQLVDLAVNKVLLNTESEDVFYKYNRIQSVKPNTASMTASEGGKFDGRYAAFVNVINEENKVEHRRIGIVKALKVAKESSEQEVSNDLSEFYQIAGKKLSSTGMYLERKKSLGINLGIDRSVAGPINTSARIEFYISKLFDGTIEPGKRAPGATSFKFYVEGGYNDGTYKLEGVNEHFEFKRGLIGVSKDYYPSRLFHWSPFVGYGMEYASWDGSDNTISSNFFEAGLRLGVNVFHNVQLIGTLKNDFLINTILLDSNKEVVDENYNYKATFENRTGISFGLGMRIML